MIVMLEAQALLLLCLSLFLAGLGCGYVYFVSEEYEAWEKKYAPKKKDEKKGGD